MIDMFKSIGIEKGKTFKPDAKMKAGSHPLTESHKWLSSPLSAQKTSRTRWPVNGILKRNSPSPRPMKGC